ncbi:FAD/NAD(P)-binding protein [Coralloluteibacterium thermophilus]|uniref:FAD/NAD(P)-binding protein n=1 Tax=Coralloluteibacterium thermophilum TaxID=2707049 RepID=A0ABV9NLG3_9GAMM
MPTHALLIVGGGAGGALVALHALRRAPAGARILLVEPAATLAAGIAYATRWPEHLLNVPAGRMSAFPDAPGDFVAALAEDGHADPDHLAHVYAPRRDYGAYLRARLSAARAASAARFEVVHGRAVALDPATGGIVLDDGRRFEGDTVALALGNAPRRLRADGVQAVEAWDYDAIRGIPVDARVAIVGAGLSMVDALLSLDATGHRGPVEVLSRHALLPRPHAAHGPAFAADLDALLALPGVRARTRLLRRWVEAAAAQGLPWQAVMEALRPHVQRLWRTLGAAEQRRFLRHAVRHWDVHRHRIAPEVHATVQAAIDAGRVRLHRGRALAIARDAGGLRIETGAGPLRADVVVNATGVESAAARMRNPLLDDLLARGAARPGPHGIGVDTDAEGALLDAAGTPQPRVRVAGSLRIGTLWESLAVPELRVQAAAIAAHAFPG